MIFFKARKMAQAINDNDLARVKALLDAGVSTDVTSDSYHYPPLQRAVINDRLEIAELLMDKEASGLARIQYVNGKYMRLFAHTVHRKSFKMADMLLRKKPGLLNEADSEGKTPLAHMAEDGNIEALQYLLEKGANTTIKTKDNRTPYFLAQSKGRQDVMDLLAPYYVSPVQIMPAATTEQEGWKKLADDRIACVTVEKDIGYKITEIFNFTSRERRTICLNIESKHEVIETKEFDDISNKATLQAALAELQKQGGTASSDSISGIYKSAPKLK